MTVRGATARANEFLCPCNGTVKTRSGPRLLRVANTVSKPRIWNRGVKAVLLETEPTLQTAGLGRATTLFASIPPCADVTSMLDCRISLASAIRKLSNNDE